jgi:hypothetical protein
MAVEESSFFAVRDFEHEHGMRPDDANSDFRYFNKDYTPCIP